MAKNELRPKADIGDLVKVAGYGNRVFRVDSVNYEYYRDAEIEIDVIYYDTTDVETNEWIIAHQLDISVLMKAKPGEAKYAGIAEIRQAAQPSVKSDDKRAEIDELLDELSDYMALIELFGENADYREKIHEIKVKLERLAKEGTDGGIR